jgi:hypothetical protein
MIFEENFFCFNCNFHAHFGINNQSFIYIYDVDNLPVLTGEHQTILSFDRLNIRIIHTTLITVAIKELLIQFCGRRKTDETLKDLKSHRHFVNTQS